MVFRYLNSLSCFVTGFTRVYVARRCISLPSTSHQLSSMPPVPGTLYLFDIDGTITEPRQVINNEMLEFLRGLSQEASLAIVGGSDYAKALEQLGSVDNTKIFEFMFSENGLIARRKGEIIAEQSIGSFLSEELVQKFINYCLGYMSKVELPVKRGVFIEYRTGLINVCPVGRSCSQAERKQFARYDAEHKIREKFVADLKEKFAETPLNFCIGGEISFDVFPKGWDKTYCLRFLDEYSTIHFFGDKTDAGGNDHEIYSHPRVIGHKVRGPTDTLDQLKQLIS